MGPAAKLITGLLALILPINCAGIVLSQPPIMTQASIGYPTDQYAVNQLLLDGMREKAGTIPAL